MTPASPSSGSTPEQLLAAAKAREKRAVLVSFMLICGAIGISLVLVLTTVKYGQSQKEDLTIERDIASLRDSLTAKILAAGEHEKENHNQIQKLNSELAALTSLIKASSAAAQATTEQLAQMQNQLSLLENKAQLAKSDAEFARKNLDQKIDAAKEGTRQMEAELAGTLEALANAQRDLSKQLQSLTARVVEVETRANQEPTAPEDAKRSIGQK